MIYLLLGLLFACVLGIYCDALLLYLGGNSRFQQKVLIFRIVAYILDIVCTIIAIHLFY